jgi:hypothetical protein
MSAIREAIVLPLVFLTVILLGGIRPGATLAFAPPTLFGLVLAIMLMGALVRSGVLAAERLTGGSRSALANANGATLLVTAFAAGAELMSLVTPDSGLPLFFVSVFLFVLLLNAIVAWPDRIHLLRSLLVILGAAFVLKFIVFASLSDPGAGRMKRVFVAMFDAATLGGIAQQPQPPLAGYLAFATIVLYLGGIAALPRREPPGVDLVKR